MEPKPLPIPTAFEGYRFRSRLEARWALFFDVLRVKWQYELDGFETPQGWYLPDFSIAGKWWAEVKPVALDADEMLKAESIVAQTRKPILLLEGMPDFQSYRALVWQSCGVDEHQFVFPSTNTHGRFNFNSEVAETDVESLQWCPRYSAAVFGARGARFEKRETRKAG